MNIDIIAKRFVEELKQLNDQDVQRISLIVNDFKERLYYELKSLKLDIQSTYKLISEELELNLTEVFVSANEDINYIIRDIIFSTKDVIVATIDNKITNSKNYLKIKKVFQTKIDDIYLFTDAFNDLYKQNFDVFLYKLSINNDLKNKPIIYNCVVNAINENKKDLIDEFVKVINNKKKCSVSLFDDYFQSYIEKIMDKKNDVKINNNKIIGEYATKLLEDAFLDNIDKYLRLNYDLITEEISKCYYEVLRVKKLKDSKTNKIILNDLLEYLYGYNNTLFDKANITIQRMKKIITYDDEKSSEKLKDYNDNIYKVFNLQFNFDKQFDEFRVKLLSKRNISNSEKIINDVNVLVYDCRDKIISLMKENLTLSFKDNMSDLNRIVSKTMGIKLKCKNLDIKITSSLLKDMYK